MPNSKEDCQLTTKLSQLAATLAAASTLVDEIIADVGDRLMDNPDHDGPLVPTSAVCSRRSASLKCQPTIDWTTFSVHWDGKTCVLGNTLPLRLLERLGRRPNQFIHCDQLLDDVWQGPRSKEAVRSVVKVLRQKLIQAGMHDLAASINGNQPHHYGFIPDHRS